MERTMSRSHETRGSRGTATFRLLALSALAALTMLACEQQPTGVDAPVVDPHGPRLAAPVACGTGPGDPTNSYHAHVQWNCGDTLVFSGVPSGLESVLFGWNYAMNSAVSKAPFLARPVDIP